MREAQTGGGDVNDVKIEEAKVPVVDNETRWNGTYKCAERTYEIERDAFAKGLCATAASVKLNNNLLLLGRV